MMRRLLLVSGLLLAACGGSNPRPDAGNPPADGGDPGVPDSGTPDGGEPLPGTIAVVDWTSTRGDDLQTAQTPIGLEDELFGVTSSGLIVRSACDGGTCDYTWMGADGGIQQPPRALRSPFSAPFVSAPGTRMLMMEAPKFSSCTFQDEPLPILSGDLHLLDTETGAALSTLPDVETHAWGETQWTAAGRWFRPAPRSNGVCGSFAEELRRTEAPFDVAPAWNTNLLVEDEMPDGRWFALDVSNSSAGFVDPEVPGSFDVLAVDVQGWFVRDGWAYAYEHAPARRIAAEAPDGSRHAVEPPADEGWYLATTSERWIALREWIRTGDAYRYRLMDLRGEYEDVLFFAITVRLTEGIHLLGSEDLVVVTAPDEQNDPAARLVDLRTGEVTRLADGPMRAVTLGRGEAAIAYDPEVALLIERGRLQTLAQGPITSVYSASLPGSALPLPQRDLAMIVRSPSTGVFALDLFHLRKRQLVNLSEHIFYGPQHGWGLADEACGQPWVTRSIGDGSYTLKTPSNAFYFLEYAPWPEWPSLFVAPLDLSGPPRRLNRVLSTIDCHAPLLSLDGKHVGAMADSYDTEPHRTVHSARFE